jgi:hypothetical protein
MIININVEQEIATVELFRSSTRDGVHSLSWWSTHEDEAMQYGGTVRARIIEIPICDIVYREDGLILFRIASNSPYIYGSRGIYTIHGVQMGMHDIPNWIDVDIEDVLTVREDMYYSIYSCITLCLGSRVANRVLASI